MNVQLIEAGLKTTAYNSERIAALQEAGLPTHTLAKVFGAKESTLRNWVAGVAQPRAETAIKIDDLRYAMGQLMTTGLTPDRAVNWMQSRSAQEPFERPIEVIADNPQAVFAMIAAVQPV